MSYTVPIKRLSEISSNIVSWFNANDINLPIGSYVNVLTGRDGKDSAAIGLEYTNSFTLALDSVGFKCLKSTAVSAFYQTGTSIAANNAETFIFAVDSSVAIPVLCGHFYNTIQNKNNGFSYLNFTVGSGRINTPTPVLGKVVITCVVSMSYMRVYNGLSLIAELLNPALYTLPQTPSTGRSFNIQVNSSNSEVSFYAAIRIQEVLEGEKLKQAIRSVAFENGVKI